MIVIDILNQKLKLTFGDEPESVLNKLLSG